MPKVESIPQNFKAFVYHGVDVSDNGSSQVVAECPFCGKLKWYCAVATGLWDCKVCGAKGNPLDFIRQMHEVSNSQPPLSSVAYQELAAERKLLFVNTLVRWGVCQSLITGEWLMPGYGVDDKLNQLYKYVLSEGKRRLLPTPGVWEEGKSHALFFSELDTAKPELWVCEGPWDGMALEEMLRQVKQSDNGTLSLTGNENSSLHSRINVVAVPGANVFRPEWCRLAAGKKVVLLYDNDHPHAHPRTGQTVEGAGILGMRRVANMLADSSEPPESICWLAWGPDGFSTAIESGYDVRDWLSHE
jgi:hypothetical protein